AAGWAAALRGFRRGSKRVPVALVDREHSRGDADEGAAEDAEADRACGPADEGSGSNARGGHSPEQCAGSGRPEGRTATTLHARARIPNLVTAKPGLGAGFRRNFVRSIRAGGGDPRQRRQRGGLVVDAERAGAALRGAAADARRLPARAAAPADRLRAT